MPYRHAVAALIGFLGVGLATAAWASADTVFGVPRHSWDLALKLINFSILAFVIVKYGKAPLMGFLRGQREAVAGQFEELKSEAQQIEDLQAEQDRLIAGLDAKIAEIVKYYQEIGTEEKRMILERAEATRDFMLKDADASIAREFEESRKIFRAEVIDIAVSLAGTRIEKNLNASDQGKLLNDYMTKLSAIEVAAE